MEEQKRRELERLSTVDLVSRLRNYNECHDGDVDEAADRLEQLQKLVDGTSLQVSMGSTVRQPITEEFLRSHGMGWVAGEGDWKSPDADGESPFAYIAVTDTIEIRMVPYVEDQAWAVYFTFGQPATINSSQHVRDVHSQEEVLALLKALNLMIL